MTQPIIRFQGVSKAFGTQTVLRDFSLDVEPGAFVSIIGRSGCGKTTVLKLVNGLLSPDTGRVLIQGQDVARIDPVALRRRIGYAIQNVGLFPHMTVEKNIAYVPGQFFCCDGSGKNAMRLNFSTTGEEDIARCIPILGEMIKQYLKK